MKETGKSAHQRYLYLFSISYIYKTVFCKRNVREYARPSLFKNQHLHCERLQVTVYIISYERIAVTVRLRLSCYQVINLFRSSLSRPCQ